MKNAINRLKFNKEYEEKYCFKADISNYFNSIEPSLLIEKLSFLNEKDELLYRLFEKILREDRVYDNGVLVKEKQGAMAGTPCSPFFANVYLSDVDRMFHKELEYGIEYFRYSDDVLIFANSYEQLINVKECFEKKIYEHRLELNLDKVYIYNPGDKIEFLGLSYCKGIIDISDNTKRKLKAKIKRKSHALRRWAIEKNLDETKAAKGFINSMNRKFYGKNYNNVELESAEESGDFTWCKWFFPNITIDTSLEEIDKYMQQYIRYIITGRHYKGNYRITYEQIKKWGYKSLVHEYYLKKRE